MLVVIGTDCRGFWLFKPPYDHDHDGPYTIFNNNKKKDLFEEEKTAPLFKYYASNLYIFTCMFFFLRLHRLGQMIMRICRHRPACINVFFDVTSTFIII
jgi:hypothetical protein